MNLVWFVLGAMTASGICVAVATGFMGWLAVTAIALVATFAWSVGGGME